ncbi:MAG: 1,3-beta-galactosyl-N-acetylhexosamine phosphorylase [Oscillospiraceae bacterium]
MDDKKARGGFTLPGEAGYEALTLELAERWGADVIRDSDGTALSEEITGAGYGIYSTICIVRDHNEWAEQNLDKLQQTFLCTAPAVAEEETLDITIMDGFFREQFRVNDLPEAFRYWQVYDRTTNKELPREDWSYSPENGIVSIQKATPWHKYTVSFLAFRIWEEISMYNHTTNSWDKEHLMQIDPMYPEAANYLKNWLEDWCRTHPATTVVRFTSLFYNFAWIWGSDERNRNLFTDWASYDFTVSARALDEFERRYGYAMTAEDFINKGSLRPTHMVPDRHKLDWMAFIGEFVRSFGRELIDIVHRYGKKAYVFYDDSWVGLEPYSGHFAEFGFDGLIKCVFSGFEVRLCAGVGVETHELRLHPYLFPVGLGGLPTFREGGNPTLDAKKYWNSVRRALLRQPVDRIGLGGYLHLVEPYPDFVDYIQQLTEEFHAIRGLHSAGAPFSLKPKVAVLTAWGKLRSWTLSGHFHETHTHDLIHILESLSGLPFEVEFLSFEEVEQGVPEDIDVIINAGYKGSAWSGGEKWKIDRVVENMTAFVARGGGYIGVDEPSAVDGYDTLFRMAPVLGVDVDDGRMVCHGRWAFDVEPPEGLLPDGFSTEEKPGVRLTDGKAKVLHAAGELPAVTVNSFGKGKGIYLSSYRISNPNTRMLANLILHAAGEDFRSAEGQTDNVETECAVYPASGQMVLLNNSGEQQTAAVRWQGKEYSATLQPYETAVLKL